MSSLLQHLTIVLLPLIVSNTLHMLIVKRGYLKELNHPISKTLFGENKTWRGLVFVQFANAFILQIITIVFYLNVYNAICLGFMLGLSYMLFELPNSFMKRKLGIASGKQSKKNKRLFMLIDKTDSAFGVNLVYFLLGYVNSKYAIILFLISALAHTIISKLLLQIKLKKSF